MRIGIVLGDIGIPADLAGQVQQAADAEAEGFDSAWYGQIFGHDGLSVVALAGQRTQRIELGTGVIPIHPRHPFAMAQQAMTTQVACGGRLALGIGVSHQPIVEGMWGLSYERPAKRMREYLSVLLAITREGRVAHAGEFYRTAAGLQMPGARPFPVLIAALAPAMLRLAGEIADGTVTWMTGLKTVETHIVPRINAAAEAAGRPRPRVCVAVPLAVSEDVAEARRRATQQFLVYGQLPNYRRMLDIEGAQAPGDVALTGDEAAVERGIRAFASAGVTDLLATVYPASDDAAASMARTRALLRSLVGRV